MCVYIYIYIYIYIMGKLKGRTEHTGPPCPRGRPDAPPAAPPR